MKLPTHVPVVPRCTKPPNLAAGSESRRDREIPRAVEPTLGCRATHFLEGTGHSRTLYTSKALDQSNFIL
jgi:hypothetical protein